jgi:hypothetical protein
MSQSFLLLLAKPFCRGKPPPSWKTQITPRVDEILLGKKLVKSTAYGGTVQQGAEMHSLEDSFWTPESDKPDRSSKQCCCFRTMNPEQYCVPANTDYLKICIFEDMNSLQGFVMQ